jgi:hypothetical protein
MIKSKSCMASMSNCCAVSWVGLTGGADGVGAMLVVGVAGAAGEPTGPAGRLKLAGRDVRPTEPTGLLALIANSVC